MTMVQRLERIMTYTVTNIYGISGDSTHRTPEAAIKASRKREGDGWVVIDSDGNRWDDCGGSVIVSDHANERL